MIIAQYWWSGRHLDEEVPTCRGVQFRGEVYGPGSDGRSSWGLGWVTWGGAGAPGGCKNVFRSISGDTGGGGGGFVEARGSIPEQKPEIEKKNSTNNIGMLFPCCLFYHGRAAHKARKDNKDKHTPMMPVNKRDSKRNRCVECVKHGVSVKVGTYCKECGVYLHLDSPCGTLKCWSSHLCDGWQKN